MDVVVAAVVVVVVVVVAILVDVIDHEVVNVVHEVFRQRAGIVVELLVADLVHHIHVHLYHDDRQVVLAQNLHHQVMANEMALLVEVQFVVEVVQDHPPIIEEIICLKK
jgi:hypothetical protein